MSTHYFPGKYVIISIALSLLVLISVQNSSIFASNSPKMTQHTLNNQLRIQLPVSTKLSHEELYYGSEIIYSVYLADQEISYIGYIQLWQLPDLKLFLEKSEETSIYDFVSHSIKPFIQHHHKGFVNEWTASFGNLYSISGKEYWLAKDSDYDGASLVLRISLFTTAASFTAEQVDAAEIILGSLQWD